MILLLTGLLIGFLAGLVSAAVLFYLAFLRPRAFERLVGTSVEDLLKFLEKEEKDGPGKNPS